MTEPHIRLHVAVGVVRDATGRVLIAKRPQHKQQGGLWEFPGGKINPGESLQLALQREFKEELGLNIKAIRPLIKIAHDYPDYSVILDVCKITAWSGIAHGREGQLIEWCPVERLTEKTFPEANYPIISAIRLPSIYFITPEPMAEQDDFIHGVEQVLVAGCRLVQFRSKRMAADQQLVLIRKLLGVCDQHDAKLLVNSTPRFAIEAGAHGVHLNSQRLMQTKGRVSNADFIMGASCHNQHELQHASELGLDFAVLGPIRATESHPEVSPIGWEGFKSMLDQICIPVYALGGLQLEDLQCVWEHGGQGLAMISGLWSRKDQENFMI